jgi:pimeloyl-ACP methyl ester carboxylesterase
VARIACPGRLVDVGGHRLHINCTGTGSPAVIFDAALGASSLSWTLVQPDVAALTRACSYDRAGLGWSEAGPMPRTAGRVADELHALLTRAGVAPPYVLVGHSFGGLVMRVFTARHPEHVAGLVLADPAHPEEWLQPREHDRRQIERGMRLCRHGATAARLGIARAVAALIDLGALAPARAMTSVVSRGRFSRADEEILAPLWKLPPEVRRPLRRFWTESKFFDALGSQIGSICESAAETEHAGVDALAPLPLVVIASSTCGERRLQLHTALARASSRGRLVVAPNSGHWVPLDEPRLVVDEIAGVIAAVREP